MGSIFQAFHLLHSWCRGAKQMVPICSTYSLRHDDDERKYGQKIYSQIRI